jgi:hypothetical protein
VFLKMGIHKTMGFTPEMVWNGPSLDDLGYSHFGKPPNCLEPSKERMSGSFGERTVKWWLLGVICVPKNANRQHDATLCC